MADELRNKVIVIAGERGSGKTNTGKAIMQAYYEKNGADHKILIVDTLDHPQYHHIPAMRPEHLKYWTRANGVYRIFCSVPEGATVDYNLRQVCTQTGGRYPFTNGLLVIEDTTKLLEGKLDEYFKIFITDSKQINVDVLMMFHGFCFIPPRLWKFIDQLVIHKTKEQWSAIKSRIPAAPLVEAAFNRVQANSSPYYCEMVNL